MDSKSVFKRKAIQTGNSSDGDIADSVKLDFNETKELWDKKCEARKKLLLENPDGNDDT